MERRDVFDPTKGPFFKHGTAQYWLARNDGQIVGRISAQIDYAQPKGLFDDAGLFGSLDTIDDEDIVRALLGMAEDWLHDQGYERAFGPVTLSMNEEPGLMVEGHDEPAVIAAPWHPAYLAKHLEACGYTKKRDLHFWRCMSTPSKLAELKAHKSFALRQKEFTVRSLNLRDIKQEIETIRMVYNDAWQHNWGFLPIEPHDLDGIASDLKPFLKSEYGIFVEKDGRTVGVAMVIPNLYEIFQDIGPDLSPLGWIRFLYRMFFHRFKTGRIILLGVLSEYRHSVGGAVIGMQLVDEIVHRFRDYKHKSDWIEAGWVLDENEPLQKILEQFEFRRTRAFRLYDKPIAVS